MSSNHYSHIPPPPANMYSVAGNMQNPDSRPLPKTNNYWSFNHSSEIENREKYMETELTDELYNNCDNGADQNEIPDDEPCPPPGLRRFVTGQTVSFDEGPNSPPFDRVVPGEGSAFNSYPTQSQLPPAIDTTVSSRFGSGSGTFKSYPAQSQFPPVNNATVSDRIVSGSSAFDSYPNHVPLPPVNDTSVSERFVSGSVRNEYNSLPQNTFVSVPSTKQDKQEPTQFCNDNFCAPETQCDDFFDSYLRAKNITDERATHQPQVKNKPISLFQPPKSQQQQQSHFTSSKITPNPNAASSSQNYQHRSQPVKQENTVQYDNTFPQQTLDDFAKSKNEMNNSAAVSGSTELELEVQNTIKHQEKPIQNDKILDKKLSNRMVVEGATNAPQPKITSTSTPVHSPSYDHWYENKVVPNNYEFLSVADARNVHTNRTQNDKSQITQSTTMTQLTPVTASHTSMHSKTASMSSNTSSVNEMSSYQHNESYLNAESTQKCKEEFDSMDNSASKFNHRSVRSDEIETKSKSVDAEAYDTRLNDKSNNMHGESDGYTNMQNKIRKDNDRSKYCKDPIVENPESLSGGFNREPLSGAQNISGNRQKSFPKPSVNTSSPYAYQNEIRVKHDDDERDETERYSDSDEKRSMNQRMVPGYNYNTFPVARKNHSKLYSDPRYDRQMHTNVKPPLDTRIVLGEKSSDVSFKVNSSRDHKDEYECDDPDMDRERNRLYDEERVRRNRRDVTYRHEKDKKSSRRGPRNESDDEYSESLDPGYDVFSDRGFRSYREEQRRGSPTRYKKPPQRIDCESSSTQDDSFNEDKDDDRETYPRYDSRRHPRRRPYMPYNTNPVERVWGYHDRSSHWDGYARYSEDMYINSRPSSRSGSRDQMEFSNYGRGFKFPFYNPEKSHPNFSEFQYWSKMRQTDPRGYMHWFRETYPQEYSEWYYSRCMKQKSYPNRRRDSGNSGQSSINDSVNEILMATKDIIIRDDPENMSAVCEERSSPFKFKMPHVKGLFNSLGQLIVVNESSPKEGQLADIDVYEISAPDDDPDVVEFMNFTGPFIVGETHINTVSEFVRYHAASASTSSEKLLYLLIDLIIKLRGVTDGIAISELLMSTYRETQKLNAFPPKSEVSQTFSKSGSAAVTLSEPEILEKYTDLLLLGNKNAALDWAINHKLWGHAFLLASKMGNKHYSHVLAKFDASIPTNNPLRTLYQLYSNQIPQAATACGDEKWGDWRPHLAMILSNPTPDNEVDKTAIMTLGDSLYSKDIFASHFCYLAAEATFDVSSKPSAKLSLLSLRNGVDHFGVNTSNHAILLTQTYEFAKRLQRKEFIIPALLPYKYLLAVRLIDFGKCDVALQYLESVAVGLSNAPDDANEDLICNVLELAESIKYSDSKPFVADRSTDPPWLKSLRELVATTGTQCESSNEQHSSKDAPLMNLQTLSQSLPGQRPQQQQPSPPPPQQQQQQPEQYQDPSRSGIQPPLMFSPFQQQQPPRIIAQNPGQPTSLPLPQQDQQQPWEINSFATNNHNSFTDYLQLQNSQPLSLNNEASFSVDQADFNQFQKGDDQQNGPYSPWDQPPQPAQISMHSTSNNYFDDSPSKPTHSNAVRTRVEEHIRASQTSAAKEADKEVKDRRHEKENGSWLSTLGNLIKPKNQMKLPDDKNKSIVWDKNKKQWVDKDAEGDDSPNVIQPPPRASELPATAPTPDLSTTQPPYQTTLPRSAVGMHGHESLPNIAPPTGANNNVYKLPKGRGTKNYVNVWQQNATSPASSMPKAANLLMDSSSSAAAPPPNVNYFMPSSG